MWANKKNNTGLASSKRNTQIGFTIVETLIVLAVTGAMFVATALLVQGQVSKYQYRGSMQQVQVLIQKQINDVQSGYFPEAANKDCNGAPVSDTGKDQTCVIIGKRITLVRTTPDFYPGPAVASHAKDTANPDVLRVDTLGASLSSLPIEPTPGNYAGYLSQVKFINTTYEKLPGSIKYNAAACPGVATPATASCPFIPKQYGDSIEINILYSSATRGQTGGASYYDSGQVVSSGDSVSLYTNYLQRLPSFSSAQYQREGRLACFTDGKRFGSISFGNTSSGSVDLRIEDERCRFST